MISLADIVFLGALGAAFHYLTYRAEITRWLWSRYPKPVDKLLGCSACSGFWVGAGIGALARWRGYGLLGLSPDDWLLLPACALVAVVATPPLAFMQVYALQALGGDEEEKR